MKELLAILGTITLAGTVIIVALFLAVLTYEEAMKKPVHYHEEQGVLVPCTSIVCD